MFTNKSLRGPWLPARSDMAGSFRRTDWRFATIIMFILAFIHDATCGRLEPGIEEFTLATSNYFKNMPVVALRAIRKSMFKNTPVKITIAADDVFCNTSFAVAWELRYTRCAQLYTAKNVLFIQDLMMDPSTMYSLEPEIVVIRNGSDFYTCSDVVSGAIHPQFPPSSTTTCYVPRRSSQHTNCKEGNVWGADLNVDADTVDGGETGTGVVGDKGTGDNGDVDTGDDGDTGTDDSGDAGTDDNGDTQGTDDDGDAGADDNGDAGSPDGSRRRKRENEPSSPEDPYEPAIPEDSNKNVVAHTPTTGSYLLMLNISTEDIAGGVSFQVTIDMKGPYGYLSATQYPLLKFYEVMCGVDALLFFIWLFLLYRHYRNLLGIHIWIGVVIFFGLLEKIAFYGEFEHMNNKGTESSTGILLAELMSCVRKTLARLLMVIVSIGYGVTKHTLGADTKYLVTFGLLYMTLSTAEAVMRVSESYEHSMVAVFPLAVLELILLVWIFRELRKTTQRLRLDKRKAKLQRYILLMATAVLVIVCSVSFSIWSMKTHRFSECVEKNYGLWLDDAFWGILFHLILFVIMIVFRPQNGRTVYIKLLRVNVITSSDKNEVSVKKDSPRKSVKDIAGYF